MQAPDKQDCCDFAKLIPEELDQLANRTVRRAFERVGRDGPLAIPHLRHAARVLFADDWDRDRTAALVKLIDTAADKLPKKPFNESTGMTWPELARGLYNVAGKSLSHVDGSKYSYLLETTLLEAGLSNISKRTRNRRTNSLREKLADAIGDLIAEQEIAVASETLPDATPRMTERPEYIAKIREVIKEDKPVVIWGEAGTGKTELAKEAARQLAAGPVVVLRAGGIKVLADDIIDALIAEGLDPSSWTEAYCRSQLRRVLSEEPLCRFLVIDDPEDEESVWQLIPENPSIPVIITTRTKLRSAQMATLELLEFTETQGEKFLADSPVALSGRQISLLIEYFGLRPLALHHTAQYLSETAGIKPDDLLSDLAFNVPNTLSIVAHRTFQEKNLTHVYDAMVGVALTDPATRSVLDTFLALTGRGSMLSTEFLSFALETIVEEPLSKLQASAGLRVLRNYGLLRQDGEVWIMHQLTNDMLRTRRGAQLLPIEFKYLTHLFRGGIAVPQEPMPGYRGQMLGFIKQLEVMATAYLIRGWKFLLCVDSYTWLAIQEKFDRSEAAYDRIIRYDVFSSGIYTQRPCRQSTTALAVGE